MTVAFATLPFEYATSGGASSFAKLRAINVAAGSLLFCFTWQYNITNTCSGVADDLGGTWVKAFGPIRGNSDNSNASLYGWYKPNSSVGGTPTKGTVTATWSGSAGGGILIGEVTGLAGGGTLDQTVSAASVTTGAPSFGTTGTLAQAAEAAVQMMVANHSGTGPLSGWTADAAPDSALYERSVRQITAATTALVCGWAGTNSWSADGGAMTFKDLGASGTFGSPYFNNLIGGSRNV